MHASRVDPPEKSGCTSVVVHQYFYYLPLNTSFTQQFLLLSHSVIVQLMDPQIYPVKCAFFFVSMNNLEFAPLLTSSSSYTVLYYLSTVVPQVMMNKKL